MSVEMGSSEILIFLKSGSSCEKKTAVKKSYKELEQNCFITCRHRIKATFSKWTFL